MYNRWPGRMRPAHHADFPHLRTQAGRQLCGLCGLREEERAGRGGSDLKLVRILGEGGDDRVIGRDQDKLASRHLVHTLLREVVRRVARELASKLVG